MKSDWIPNAIFTTLATAAFYVLQPALETAGILHSWSVPIAALTSAIGVGVILRILTTVVPLRFRYVRRWLLPESSIEGLWLEILNRRGKQHYSIVSIEYDPVSKIDPFSMIGSSFFPDGNTHSRWTTRFVRIKSKADGFSVEYIYTAECPGQNDKPKNGYGESSFTVSPAQRSRPIVGTGYYLAAEEDKPFRCAYELLRIDEEFKRDIGAQREKLKSPESLKMFIRLADDYFRNKAGYQLPYQPLTDSGQ